MVFHHSDKFGGSRYCGSRDRFLVCHVILQDHVMKGLCHYTWIGAPQVKPPTCQV